MKHLKGSKKAREEARQAWVDRMTQRLFARHAAEYELESFASGPWNDAWDEACDWCLEHHPEVHALRRQIRELKEELFNLEEKIEITQDD